MIQIAVLAGARRERLTEQTCERLDVHGAARALQSQKRLFYSAPHSFVSPKVPNGWEVVRRFGPMGARADFEWMVNCLSNRSDALLFEDDITPVGNAVTMMARISVPSDCAFVSFYDFANITNGGPEIIEPPPFYGTQAIRLAANTIREIQTGRFVSTTQAQDSWLGEICRKMGKRAVVYPSMVQHIGVVSIANAGGDLTGLREPSKSFPEPFDLPQNRVIWCSFHGCEHEHGTICPIKGE